MSDINLLPEEEKKREVKKIIKKPEIEMTKPLGPFKGEKPEISKIKRKETTSRFFDFLKKLGIKTKTELKPEIPKIINVPKRKLKKPRPAMLVSEKILPKESWVKRFFSKLKTTGSLLLRSRAGSSLSPRTAEGIATGSFGLRPQDDKKISSSEMEINLLPEEIAVLTRAKKQKTILFTTLIVSLLLVISLYVGFSIYQSKIVSESKKIQARIFEIEKEIKEYEKKEKEPEGLREKINAINNLLENHIYWTKFFALLEKYTIPEVSYLNFSGGQGKEITLNAIAKDYTALAKQFVVFQEAKDFVKEVKISSASLQGGKEGEEGEESVVSFSVTLELQPGVFFAN